MISRFPFVNSCKFRKNFERTHHYDGIVSDPSRFKKDLPSRGGQESLAVAHGSIHLQLKPPGIGLCNARAVLQIKPMITLEATRPARLCVHYRDSAV